jgi:LAO/AO transport system kinase
MTSGLVNGVLDGHHRAIAKMMSVAETRTSVNRDQLSEIDRRVGNTHVIDLAGVPGSGKSTLVQSLTKQLRSKDLRVGIVDVHPSSPFTRYNYG